MPARHHAAGMIGKNPATNCSIIRGKEEGFFFPRIRFSVMKLLSSIFNPRVKNMRLIIWAAAISILFFAQVPAYGEIPAPLPYHLKQPITVVSESAVSGSRSGEAAGVFWNIVPETGEDGSSCLGFYRPETGDPVCRLVRAGAGAVLYLADGTPFRHALSAGGMTLFTGFSVPCDILPVAAACGDTELEMIEIRRQAGERTFIEKFQVDCISVSLTDARDQGWIRASAGDVETLRMIQVTRLRNGEHVVRQLWVPGETWWRYEETPHRRSWRLP